MTRNDHLTGNQTTGYGHCITQGVRTLGLIFRNKYYLGFVGIAVGFFLYAGLTGNFGIFPRLPFDLPFSRVTSPGSIAMAAPVMEGLYTGEFGFSANELQAALERGGAMVRWERSQADESWIMRYSLTDELSGELITGAGRFTFVRNVGRPGTSGPAFVVTGWVEDGYDHTAFDIVNLLSQLAVAVRSVN